MDFSIVVNVIFLSSCRVSVGSDGSFVKVPNPDLELQEKFTVSGTLIGVNRFSCMRKTTT